MLTPKQKRFVEEYQIDLDARQAALRAGYSPKTAHNATVHVLRKPEVRQAVDEALAERSVRTQLTADRVARELMHVAFFDPRRLFGPDGQPLPIGELDPETASALSTLELRVRDGETVLRYRAYDKLRALELLSRRLAPDPSEAPEAGVILLPPPDAEEGETEKERETETDSPSPPPC